MPSTAHRMWCAFLGYLLEPITEKANQSESISRSTLEAYLGTAIGIIALVWPMTWQLKAVLLLLLLVMIGDIAARNRYTRKIRRRIWRFAVVLVVLLGFGFFFFRTVQKQRAEDRLTEMNREYAPSALATDNRTTLMFKNETFVADMRNLGKVWQDAYNANNADALRKEKGASRDEVARIDAERQKRNSELSKQLGQQFREQYLTSARSLEGELLFRASQIYIGPRGQILPPSRFPMRPAILIHGELYGGQPLEDLASYLEELFKLL